MFKSSALSKPLTRTVLSALTATALFSVASISNAALFKNDLPTDKDAILSVGVNVMAVKSAYDLEDSTDIKVGAVLDN